MGAGDEASPADLTRAFELGQLLAREGWVVLSGGRNAGVMREVNRGAKSVAGSLTIGILPGADDSAAAPDVDVAIVTGMHNARNNINVLSSRVIFACGLGGPGTVSEVALALKAHKPVILVGVDDPTSQFFRRLAGEHLFCADTATEAVALARQFREA